MAYDLSHLAAMLVAKCFKTCSSSLWRSTSTDVTKGVHDPRLSPLPFSFLDPLSPQLVLVFGVGVIKY